MTDAELAIVVKLKDMFSKQLDTIVASTDKAAVKMESSWKKITNGITTAKVAVAGWLTGQVAGFATDMVQLGAKVDRASVAFGTLAKGIRLDTTEAMAGLRAAASGTISDLDLMTVANKAMLTGVAGSSIELERLVLTGRKLGSAMGLSSQEGIERLTQGLVSQQTEALRSIGITINLESAAKKLGITLSDLTAEERQNFFAKEVWKVAAERMKLLGDNTSVVSANVARMGAAWDNAKAKLASFIALSFTEKDNKTGETWGGWGLNVLPPVAVYNLLSKYEEMEKARQKFISTTTKKASNRAPWGTPDSKEIRNILNRADSQSSKEANMQAMNGIFSEETNPAQAIQTPISDAALRMWADAKRGMAEYYAAVIQTMSLVQDAVVGTFNNIEVSVADVFFDTMMGKMKSFKEYLRVFVTDMARMLSQMMARNAMIGLLQAGGSALSSLGGMFSGGTGNGVDTRLGPKDFGGNIELAAVGGITNGLTIAGERGPEAVVPLPGSRSIPVEMRGGGGGGNVTYIINAIDTQSFAAALMGNKASIHRIVTEGLGMDTQLRAAARAV
jgi:hypothetical protein